MKAYEAKKMIRDVFENVFNKQKFKYFVKNLLVNLEEKTFVYTGNTIPQAYRNVVRKMERIGKFKDAEGNIIDVLIVELKNDHSVEHARTTQRNFIRRYLNGSRGNELKDAALVAFYSENSPDWRFSFIKMQYSLEKQKDELTPAKRSSFLVGKDEKSHTAQKQLLPLLISDKPPSLYDLENAFGVERVTEEFFEQYKSLLFKLKDALDKIIENNEQVRNEFERKNIDTLNFSKKLLGQIVFLYFIQKKGWLGLQKGQVYGQGDRKFLRHLFEQSQKNKSNYYNHYLKYLFYDALSKKRPTDFYTKFNCRIPFLNGGLFDPINFYDWENLDLNIPNEIFSNKNDENDEGTGILDVFDLYNFTVKEDEPLETEVAIDPEMLGKIFERLLEVKDRKSKGAFYTPREIVHYMAQQSLLYYLNNELGDILSKTDLESFINHTEHHIEKDIAIENGQLNANRNKQQIPENIKTNARRIDELLAGIKICDPAVGSGAFPVGVMHEVVKLRNLLTPFIPGNNSKRTTYHFKAHAIENSLYGVDIDEGAVEIAKLRLWLSLVVDENNIHEINPLPNLDYKIVRGNSLINKPDDMADDDKLQKEINRLINEFFPITDNHIKQEKKQLIDSKIQEQLDFVSAQMAGYKIDFDFKLFFHDVFHTKGGFDIVIGNPPYVSTKGRKETEKKVLKEVYGFVDDLYSHFFFKSFEILKSQGILSFITSNTFLTINTKKNLRKLLQQHRLYEIIKTADVFDAMVSPAITTVKNIKTNRINYELIFKDAKNNFSEPETYPVKIDIYRKAINNVFFPPTKLNMKFYHKYNDKLRHLYNNWWHKINTSKKIDKHRNELETYRAQLKPGDLTLLGLVTEGGQGLATANNGRFVGVRIDTKQAKSILKTRPEKLFKAVKENKIPLNINSKQDAENYLNSMNELEIWEFFDELKHKYGRDIFGQGYIYRIVPDELVADVDKLTDDEKKNGIAKNKPYFVLYDKGDKDGNRWYLKTPFVIDWSNESVSWLYENSGKKGKGMPVVRNPKFYFREGFCWTDVHTVYIKARIKEKGIHDVKSMSLFSLTKLVPEYYIISLLNSKFISEYVSEFVNNTQTFQINDARQLPIIVPNRQQLVVFKEIFDNAVAVKKKQFASEITKQEANDILNRIQEKLDEEVYNLYGL